MLRLSGISFGYDPRAPVLDGVDLALGPGCTLVLGPNGSGKSTLLKIAAGVERPDAGAVWIEGHDAWREEAEARRGLAYVPEHPDLSPYASVLETLQLVCRLRGQPSSAVADALDAVGLTPFARRSIRELSMGQRRRAVLGAAFIGTPRVTVLDEPLEAMDRVARQAIVDWMRRLVAGGGLVLVATHELEPLVGLATSVVAFGGGQVRLVETLPEAAADRLAFLDRQARGLVEPSPGLPVLDASR